MNENVCGIRNITSRRPSEVMFLSYEFGIIHDSDEESLSPGNFIIDYINMKLQIAYQELSELVKAKSDKIVDLSYIDSKTVSVIYTHMQKVPLCNAYIPIPVNVKVRVEAFEDGKLYLAYNAGTGLDTVISGILAIYPRLKDMNVIELQDNQKATVYLTKIEKAREALEKITVNDVYFTNEGVCVEFSLK